MYRISFYVPPDWLEPVKQALFDAGAGKIGNYECCCWVSSGTGQFKPNSAARPFIGRSDNTETLTELKVEMVCSDNAIRNALRALVDAHPYEEPAYAAWPVYTIDTIDDAELTAK